MFCLLNGLTPIKQALVRQAHICTPCIYKRIQCKHILSMCPQTVSVETRRSCTFVLSFHLCFFCARCCKIIHLSIVLISCWHELFTSLSSMAHSSLFLSLSSILSPPSPGLFSVPHPSVSPFTSPCMATMFSLSVALTLCFCLCL